MDRINTLQQFLKDNPEDSFLQHALALEYIKGGNDPAARLLFYAILNRDAGYIGSYYHLAKLLERTGETQEALEIYRQGMEASKKAGDHHTLNELSAAYDDLLFE